MVRLLIALLPLLVSAQESSEFREFIAKIHAALGLRAGSVIADIGTGDVTDQPVLVSKVIGPSGKLVCEDIDGAAIRRLEEKLKALAIVNVQFVVGEPSDPKLPAAVFDAVLISYAYHEMGEHAGAILRHAREALKPDGRLVVIEAISAGMLGKTRDEQVKAHELGPEILMREMEAAGFRQLERTVLREGEGLTRYLVSASPRQ